jgi:DNA gyrase subunit A
VPVEGIRIARRGTQGVSVFKVGDAEHVVSVAHLGDSDESSGTGGEADGEDGEDAAPSGEES